MAATAQCLMCHGRQMHYPTELGGLSDGCPSPPVRVSESEDEDAESVWVISVFCVCGIGE